MMHFSLPSSNLPADQLQAMLYQGIDWHSTHSNDDNKEKFENRDEYNTQPSKFGGARPKTLTGSNIGHTSSTNE